MHQWNQLPQLQRKEENNCRSEGIGTQRQYSYPDETTILIPWRNSESEIKRDRMVRHRARWTLNGVESIAIMSRKWKNGRIRKQIRERGQRMHNTIIWAEWGEEEIERKLNNRWKTWRVTVPLMEPGTSNSKEVEEKNACCWESGQKRNTCGTVNISTKQPKWK